jgi:hypothetical protein
MATVEFKYNPGDKVRTAVEDEGIVETCGFERGGIKKYYVVWKGATGRWFYEEDIALGWFDKKMAGFNCLKEIKI